MINREDIKEGLKFRLPNNKIERKHQGATDMCESIQYLTTLKTPHGDKNYVTLQVPLFEVCGGPKLISLADKEDPHCAWVGEYIPDGGLCVMFLKTTFLEGQKRYERLYKNTPPKYVLQFSKRVLYAKNGKFATMRNGGGSAVSYAWFVWQKGYIGETNVKWI